jgi:hypothetical protein
LVLGEFSVNDDFWGMMDVKETCGSGGAQPHSSSGGKAAARGQCLMLDTLFTESFVRNFMTLGSSVAYIRFGYGFLNNDAGGDFSTRWQPHAISPVHCRAFSTPAL